MSIILPFDKPKDKQVVILGCQKELLNDINLNDIIEDPIHHKLKVIAKGQKDGVGHMMCEVV